MQVLIYLLTVWMANGFSSCQVENPIKIMTYNIRLDNPGDNDDNWHHRKADMIAFLELEDADFIGVQEALYHQVAYLDSMLVDYAYIGVGRDDGEKAGEFMALFYKVDKWSLLNNNTFWLSDSPETPGMGWDAACNRVCTYGIFQHKDSGKKIHISNTHLDHVGVEARKNSISLLGEHINQYRKEYPSVLMGDFNFTPDDTLYTSLTSFIDDSRKLADKREENHQGTFNGFRLDGNYPRRIDYILVDANVWNVKTYKVLSPKTLSDRHVSDHLPVITELTIK